MKLIHIISVGFLILGILKFDKCNAYTNMSNYQNSAVQQGTRSKHKLSYYWLLQSFIGLIGTILNSFVLNIFVKEKRSLATSVNFMIW